MGQTPRSYRSPGVIGALLVLAATVLAVGLSSRAVDGSERQRFEAQTARLDAALADRFRAYVQVLRGGAGLFRASDDVTRIDWDRYVASLRLEERYPGFKSLTYAPAVPQDDLADFVAAVRREPVPAALGPADALRDYVVRDPAGASGSTSLHGPILYVAPFTEVNRLVLGIDMMREPTRRAAMQRSAATGQAVASPRLRLSGSRDDEAGFIVYVPIKRDGRLQGWLTAAFLADGFIDGVDEARGTQLDLEIYAAERDDPAALVYSSSGTRSDGSPAPLPDGSDTPFVAVHDLAVPGGAWKVRYVAPAGFIPTSARVQPWLVGLVGVLIALSFLVVTRGSERWRRQAEQLEVQAVGLTEAREEAEVATRAKSAFLATMSHEIRTPLNAVLGASSVLQESLLDAEEQTYVRMIRDSGEHLLQVINEILDYSRLEGGHVQLEEVAYDPADCVRSVIDLMRPTAERAGVSLVDESTTQADLPKVLGDPTRLRQVLLNLVANAVKFTPEGGSVRVLAGHRDGVLAMDVVDTGIGLSSEEADRLFEPFTQAEAATSRVYGGTGLGLSIARALVVAMGGTIAASGSPGQGARFHFTVLAEPVAAAPAADAGELQPAPVTPPAVLLGEGHPLRVLVAEDDTVSRLLLTKMLAILGYDAVAVADGREAVDAVADPERPAFDLVLLDLHMPALDGLGAAAEIRDLLGAGRPRLVALTGAVTPGDLEALDAAGLDAVVAKPFALDDLALVLRDTPALRAATVAEPGAPHGVPPSSLR
ncbi:hypothetical protein BH11ACT8_BH11ACT8_17630 [soil metagenome]